MKTKVCHNGKCRLETKFGAPQTCPKCKGHNPSGTILPKDCNNKEKIHINEISK